MKVRRYATFFALIVMLAPAAFASVTPYPPYPGAAESMSYKVSMDGQPVFTYRFPTFNQFRWMDYAGFSMTGKVHVTITSLVNDRNVITCFIRPLAYSIHPQINGKTVSFDLDQPRYLLVFINEKPTFQSNALMLFAEPPEKNPPHLGDPNVVNIMDYKVDNTGKTLDTDRINRAIRDVSARPEGGVLFFPARRLSDGHGGYAEQREALCGRGGADSRVALERGLPRAAQPPVKAVQPGFFYL